MKQNHSEFVAEMEQIIDLAEEHAPTKADRTDAQLARKSLDAYKRTANAGNWRSAKHAHDGLVAYKQHLRIRYGLEEAPEPVVQARPQAPLDARRLNQKWQDEADNRNADYRSFISMVERVISTAGSVSQSRRERDDIHGLSLLLREYKQRFAKGEWDKADLAKKRMEIVLARSGEVASEAPRRKAEQARAEEERRHREALRQRERQHREQMQALERQRQLNEALYLQWLNGRRNR